MGSSHRSQQRSTALKEQCRSVLVLVLRVRPVLDALPRDAQDVRQQRRPERVLQRERQPLRPHHAQQLRAQRPSVRYAHTSLQRTAVRLASCSSTARCCRPAPAGQRPGPAVQRVCGFRRGSASCSPAATSAAAANPHRGPLRGTAPAAPAFNTLPEPSTAASPPARLCCSAAVGQVPERKTFGKTKQPPNRARPCQQRPEAVTRQHAVSVAAYSTAALAARFRRAPAGVLRRIARTGNGQKWWLSTAQTQGALLERGSTRGGR